MKQPSVQKIFLILGFCTLVVQGCGEKRLTAINIPTNGVQECQEDSDCPDGLICVNSECVEVEHFDCKGDDLPIISVDPSELDFGEVIIATTTTKPVTITNESSCNLRLSSIGLGNDTTAGFKCDPCDMTQEDILIAPRRSSGINVTYSPLVIGAASGTLLIKSDAKNVQSTNGFFEVMLTAQYSGEPKLLVEPSNLNFGYVPFQIGDTPSSITQEVTVKNVGTGNAALKIEYITLPPELGFTIPESFADLDPSSPLLLSPFKENAPETLLTIPVTFTPDLNKEFRARLQIHADYGNGEKDKYPIELTGSSLGEPEIEVTPNLLEFKDRNDAPMRLYRTEQQTVYISNNGQSMLEIDLLLNDFETSGDFEISPPIVPPIMPGQRVAVSVFYTPTLVFSPTADGILTIRSNDTDENTINIALKGYATTTDSDDVLKVEMEFTNSGSNWASDDFRNVDLSLDSELGFICKKPTYGQASDNTLAITENPCQDWTNSGSLGTATWLSLGVNEEPERVILYGLGQDLADRKVFKVYTHYVEDCKRVATGQVANLAGVGVSILLGILGGQVGVPITLPPDQISSLIEGNCFEHASSQVKVTAYVNDAVLTTTQIGLGSKGDRKKAIEFCRKNGQFLLGSDECN
ncbi:MAG: choice-of-anchor D domain-containing protein [Myxococcota bacterium]|nr:choice-of-anchor D domain-containing protein [Myxococcota bacterium]